MLTTAENTGIPQLVARFYSSLRTQVVKTKKVLMSPNKQSVPTVLTFEVEPSSENNVHASPFQNSRLLFQE